MATNLDKDIILHHIDKVYDNLSQTTQTTNRIKLIEVVLSLIIIALSLGLVSVNQQVSLFGLNITVPLWLFILGCTWIIGVVFVFFQFLDAQRAALASKIIELYKSIGYSYNEMATYLPDTMPNLFFNSFVKYGFFKRAKFRKIIILLLSLAMSLSITFIALFAQIVAYYKVISLVGFLWWVIVSLVLQFVLTVPYFFTLLKNTPPAQVTI
jgi:hypothetical protein